MIRHGYYVEGKYFGNKFSQAEAFAQFRATQFGRPVKVEQKVPTGGVMQEWEYAPGQKQMTAA